MQVDTIAETQNSVVPDDEPTSTFAVESCLGIRTIDCHKVPGFDGHELVVACSDQASGLRAYIAIHSTRLGPALGGCRMWPYPSQTAAISDALRLAQGMSYKHAVAGTRQGGGKAVIVGDPRRDKTAALYHAFGRFVEALDGRYITAEDVGTGVDDVVRVRERTRHVAGLPTEMGGSGDPSPVTAYGVFCGIQAAVAFRNQRRFRAGADLTGATVAVQGLGQVGHALCQYLHEAGARLVVTDVDSERIECARRQFSATVVDPTAIYDAYADVFAPCALGGTLNPDTVPRLKATIVAGAANNQLSAPKVAFAMDRRGILYAPDYVINAGGIINISYEDEGYDRHKAMCHTKQIGDTLTEIFARAAGTGQTAADVADQMARQRLRG